MKIRIVDVSKVIVAGTPATINYPVTVRSMSGLVPVGVTKHCYQCKREYITQRDNHFFCVWQCQADYERKHNVEMEESHFGWG